MYPELSTPAIIVDLDIVESNIDRMKASLDRYHMQHRPHVKTHKSVYFAKKQLEAGAVGITVAKLSEAEAFYREGVSDIFVAYSLVGDDKLQRFAALHRKAHMMTTVDSREVAEGLDGIGVATGKKVPVMIEIDGGAHRGGRQQGEDAVAFAKYVSGLSGLQLVGVMAYVGQIYDCRSHDEMIASVHNESSLLRSVADAFRQSSISLHIISAGSTPASHFMEHLEGITEIRAGNYLFNDVSGLETGLVQVSDCALRVLTTVIATPLPGRATIDSGTKTLSSDRAHHSDGFGYVVGRPDIRILALNEEHGMLSFDQNAPLRIGERIEVIPNHSCVLSNLSGILYAVRQGQVVEQIPVEARGCNY